MKSRINIIFLFFLSSLVTDLIAQDTSECAQNLSIFVENAKIKNYKAAYQLYELAKVFDCEQNTPTKVTNGIIEKVAQEYGHPYVGFSKKVSRDFGKGPLFTDGFIPQEKYISAISIKLESIIDDTVASLE